MPIPGVMGKNATFSVINQGHLQKDVELPQITELVSKIASSPLRLGYDIHTSSVVPDNSALRQLVESLPQKVAIEPAMIDEREMSGKVFRLNQISVEIGGVTQRYRIAQSRSTYASKQPLDFDRIIDAYGSLDEKAGSLIRGVLRQGPNSVGAFWRALHETVLVSQLGDLNNVNIGEMRFDKYDAKRNSTGHTPDVHKGQDIVFIAFSKGEETVNHVLETFPKDWARPYVIVADDVLHYLRR